MSRLIIFIPAIDPGFDADGNATGGAMLFLLAINVLLNLPIDVFSSYGMYRIAKLYWVDHPWLAWIPLVNLWTLGSIADVHRKGCLRWILVGHQILTVLLWLAVFHAAEFGFLVKLLSDGLLLVTLLTIAGITSVFVALHRLYSLCVGKKAESYTMLSVVFSLPIPFLIMRCANWD